MLDGVFQLDELARLAELAGDHKQADRYRRASDALWAWVLSDIA